MNIILKAHMRSMLQKIAAPVLAFVLLFILLVPGPASALTAWKIGSPIVPKCTGVNVSKSACGFNDLMQLGVNVMGFSIYLMTICSVLAIVYSGFLLMSSGDDAKKRGEAKSLMRKVVIGIFVTLGAWLIVHQIVVWLGVTDPSFTMV